MCLFGRGRSALRKSLEHGPCHYSAGHGRGDMEGLASDPCPQTMPSESLLSDWKNKADVCGQLSTVVKDNGRKTSQDMMQLK